MNLDAQSGGFDDEGGAVTYKQVGMFKKGPVLYFREGLDAEGKFILQAASHLHAARIMVGSKKDRRRTLGFLLSLVVDCLTDHIDPRERLWVDDVEVYRWTKWDF